MSSIGDSALFGVKFRVSYFVAMTACLQREIENDVGVILFKVKSPPDL